MTPYALVGDVLAPEPLGRAAVVVEGGKILEIVRSPRSADLPRELREVPGLICPGFIDLQINGAFGINVEPDAEALAPPYLDYLIDSFAEEPRREVAAGVTQHRFRGEGCFHTPPQTRDDPVWVISLAVHQAVDAALEPAP